MGPFLFLRPSEYSLAPGQNHGVAVFVNKFNEVEGLDPLDSACIWTPMNEVHETFKTGIPVCNYTMRNQSGWQQLFCIRPVYGMMRRRNSSRVHQHHMPCTALCTEDNACEQNQKHLPYAHSRGIRRRGLN